MRALYLGFSRCVLGVTGSWSASVESSLSLTVCFKQTRIRAGRYTSLCDQAYRKPNRVGQTLDPAAKGAHGTARHGTPHATADAHATLSCRVTSVIVRKIREAHLGARASGLGGASGRPWGATRTEARNPRPDGGIYLNGLYAVGSRGPERTGTLTAARWLCNRTCRGRPQNSINIIHSTTAHVAYYSTHISPQQPASSRLLAAPGHPYQGRRSNFRGRRTLC